MNNSQEVMKTIKMIALYCVKIKKSLLRGMTSEEDFSDYLSHRSASALNIAAVVLAPMMPSAEPQL